MSSVHGEEWSYVADKNRDAPLRQSVVCAQRGVTLLTRAETLHCATVSSVYREEWSYVADKNIDASLRHSVVCVQGGVTLLTRTETHH